MEHSRKKTNLITITWKLECVILEEIRVSSLRIQQPTKSLSMSMKNLRFNSKECLEFGVLREFSFA